MEEQWIDDLRQRFADREQAAPDGLWDSIEAAMADRGVKPDSAKEQQKRARIVPLWLRRAAVAAACVAVLGGVTTYLVSRSGESGVATAQLAESGKAAPAAENAASAEAPATATDSGKPSLAERAIGRLTAAISSVVDNRRDDAANENTALTAETTVATAETATIAEAESGNGNAAGKDLDSRMPAEKKQNDNLYASLHNHKLPKTQPRRRQGGASVGVYGMGATSMGNGSGGGDMLFYANGVQQDAVWNNEAVLAATPEFSANSVSADISNVKAKHHQPVKLGVSARFKLTDRVGVESGAYYSYLSSDFTCGDEKSGYKTRQKLHYVGVPVKLTYSVVKTDRLDIYGGVGGAVEVGVSGNADTDYYNGNKLDRSERADVRDKRPQFSTTVSAGVQYNVSDQIGIYAEPGISYYIDNGSSVKNFYKDKKWNASLSLGLRFTFE